jgi:predicted DNA-binding helix-hairpin-helix protein
MPFVLSAPDLQQRLDLLGGDARFECVGPVYRDGPEEIQVGAVFHATLSSGRTMPLLKVLQTSECTGGCRYCAFCASRDARRTTLTPDEMARSFDGHLRAGLVRGMFLSSGIYPNPVTAMDRILETAAIIRGEQGFGGYLHLKILPGAQDAQLEAAARLASRISINLEAPSRERLRALAPSKSRPALLRSQLDQLGRLTTRGDLPVSGWTTQYVVGPSGESDSELLTTTQALYRSRGLRRAYYSRFTPVDGTPLEHAPATSRIRQNRLYQADTLMRQYGFTAGELSFDDDGRLPSDRDPKLAWAETHPERFPVEINRAAPQELIRVPGLGPTGVQRIVGARREGVIDDANKLRSLGISPRRCGGWVTLAGKRLPRDPTLAQLSLFR